MLAPRSLWLIADLVHRRTHVVALLLFLFLDLRLRIGAGILQQDGRLTLHILKEPLQRTLECLVRGVLVVAFALVAVKPVRSGGVRKGADIGPIGAKLDDLFERDE